MSEPSQKRLFTFFDCQNLFCSAKKAFQYNIPNFDPIKLSSAFLSHQYPDWRLGKIFVYTGIHSPQQNLKWHSFWTRKFQALSKDPRVKTVTRELKYSISPDGYSIPREKGIDIRIALDMVSAARHNLYDVAVIFSQDNDFEEVAKEIRAIARDQKRWIKIACAFPESPCYGNRRGINKTDWIKITRNEYDKCIDHNSYGDG